MPNSPIPPSPLRTGLERVRDHVTDSPSWVLLIRVFIGLGWLRAVVAKAADPDWWDGTNIFSFAATYGLKSLTWYEPVLDNVITPNVRIIAAVVLLGEIIVALTLLTGHRMALGLSIGIFLNLNFIAGGAVNPSIFYLVAQGCIALWMAERSENKKDQPMVLAAIAGSALFVGAVSIPDVVSLDPSWVIDDPGVITVFGAVLTALACGATGLRLSAGKAQPRRGVADLFAPDDDGPGNGVINLTNRNGRERLTFELPDARTDERDSISSRR